MGTTTGFTPDEWLGDWISFERLIDGREPELERAWRDSEQAMRGGRSVFAIMRLLFGGSMRRFWRWACRTASRENRAAVVRWHIEPLGALGEPEPFGAGSVVGAESVADSAVNSTVTQAATVQAKSASIDAAQADSAHAEGAVREVAEEPQPTSVSVTSAPTEAAQDKSVQTEVAHSEVGEGRAVPRRTGFSLEWFGSGDVSLGRFNYVLAYVIDKGLEGKPCYVFRADGAPAGCPFAVLIAMDPMPERAAYANGGLLSHLHFQYGSSERRLLRGAGASARLRHRMWYPTMCDATGPARGDRRAWASIVRSLHGLPAAPAAPADPVPTTA